MTNDTVIVVEERTKIYFFKEKFVFEISCTIDELLRDRKTNVRAVLDRCRVKVSRRLKK